VCSNVSLCQWSQVLLQVLFEEAQLPMVMKSFSG
jgi:hypothetical protein